jgi:flagellar export protein FliJ
MVKGLKSLIRLNKWKVDENRRILGSRLADVTAVEDSIIALEKELINEQNEALLAPQEAGLHYGVYADGVVIRRSVFQAELEQKESQVLVAQDVLNKSYRELKKFEILDKERQKYEQKERDKKEQNMMDELGLKSFHKN